MPKVKSLLLEVLTMYILNLIMVLAHKKSSHKIVLITLNDIFLSPSNSPMKTVRLFLFFCLSFYTVAYPQGKIEEAEESLKELKKAKSNSSSSTTYNSTNNANNIFFVDVLGGLLEPLLVYTAYGIAFESPFEMKLQGHGAFLTKHPYATSNSGNYSYAWDENSEIFVATLSNRFIFETNRLYGNHLNVDLRFLKRFELEADYLQLWEKNANFENNALGIYTALVKYNRVRTKRFNASWGLGTTYVDGDVNALGFTYALGAELFFANPFSLEANFNQSLIRSNTVNKFNALLNFYRKEYKFIGGYEHLKIGSVGFSNVSIGVGISI